MKSIGVVRKVDQLGRIVLPKELRNTMGIKVKDPLEIFVDQDSIILKKYEPNMQCMITGISSPKNRVYAGHIVLSPEGIEELKKMVTDQKENIVKE
ncbi:AbrB/MazE/SpoVT family DNA-binding domain-containing protein [Metabacillus fastidiosus]|uniref:AbrB/MazE/SpoVT family DNA-binding domain-containing protein n=1 Tax=Metabacillus fastidiosus TaxID=1458 RepID=A0ABU6P435_9BACI|nr:AbrB/MazE/SpoVT family DNA-binding domain-containing protein [Metabacillus fastidiosus]MED4404105.1 AbrB/MazE/SpoVT family DNA-binding domain-containing protein [Metabacillus fastidiosus]